MRLAGLVVGIACAVATVGCGNPVNRINRPKVSEDKPAAVALVFVDVSKSTVRQRERYGEYFRRVMYALTGGTLLLADQIDANPLSSVSLPVRAFLEKSSLLGKNARDVKRENDTERARATAAFSTLLRRRPKGDSILAALNIADDVFAAYPDAKAKYLVILSDMVENSSRYRFTVANLKLASVTEFVRREREEGRLPDLHGVQAYVAGAGATRGVETLEKRVRAVRQFWTTYLETSGASLPRYGYGPELIRFP